MAEGDAALSPQSGYLELPGGGRLRLAHWPPPGRPRATVLLLHGRTEFNEKYEETADDMRALGFETWSFDWRGQGLSTRFVDDRQKGHLDHYDRLVEDLQAVIRHVREAEGDDAPRPLLLLAHSMGGLAALRYLATGTRDVAAAVLSGPLLGIGPGPFPTWFVRLLARLAVLFGQGRRFALAQGPWFAGRDRFEGNVLTSDPDRHAVHQRWFREQPDLALGGVTWGWLDATIKACRDLLRPTRARRVAVPILLGLAGRDAVVSRSAIIRMAELVPGAVLKTYPGAQHELLMERDEIRDAFLADCDAFVKGLGI